LGKVDNAATKAARRKKSWSDDDAELAQAAAHVGARLSAGANANEVLDAANALHAAFKAQAHARREHAKSAGGDEAAGKFDNTVSKATDSFNRLKDDASKLGSAVAKAGKDAAGVVTAPSGSAAGQAAAGFVGDVGAALSAVGDIVGGPVGAV